MSRRIGVFERVWIRLLHLLFRIRRGMTIGIRAVVRSDKGEFLLVRHTYTSGWFLPGGGVELGETAEQALSRELEQETGLRVIGRPGLHGVFFNGSITRRDHVLVYLCDTMGEIHRDPGSLEIAEIGFFGIDRLPEDTDGGTKRRLAEIVNHSPPAQQW